MYLCKKLIIHLNETINKINALFATLHIKLRLHIYYSVYRTSLINILWYIYQGTLNHQLLYIKIVCINENHNLLEYTVSFK